MMNGAAQNFAQHVAAPFVGGNHSVVDQKCGGPGVIGDDAQRRGASATLLQCFFLLQIDVAKFSGAFYQRRKQIRFVV